jgi:hypothetical protein
MGRKFCGNISVNMDSIYIVPDFVGTITFKKPTSEEYDEDEDAYYTTSLKILPEGTKKAIDYESPVRLYINKKLLPTEKMKDDDDSITVNEKSLGEDEFIFKYRPKNNELTRSLQEILDLIETSEHLGITNYNDFVNKFDDLLIENDLDYINSIHVEMIGSVLIRDTLTGKRPNFLKEKLDDYEIIRVSKSVMDGPLAVSLSFERLNDQFTNLETYEKDEVSMMDNLFL